MNYKISVRVLVFWSELRDYLLVTQVMLSQLVKVFQRCALIMDPAIGCITRNKDGR